jgi:hypothetical protein
MIQINHRCNLRSNIGSWLRDRDHRVAISSS